MQSVATYSEKEIENLKIFADLINRNDTCGLANHLLQEQKHQMQSGGKLNNGQRDCNHTSCGASGGIGSCGFCVLLTPRL